MTNFIQLTAASMEEHKIMIKVSSITAIMHEQYACTIYIEGKEDPFSVKETYEDIIYTVQLLSEGGGKLTPIQKSDESESDRPAITPAGV